MKKYGAQALQENALGPAIPPPAEGGVKGLVHIDDIQPGLHEAGTSSEQDHTFADLESISHEKFE